MTDVSLTIELILMATSLATISYCLHLRRRLSKSSRHSLLFEQCQHPWLICDTKLTLLEVNQYARLIFGDNCHQHSLDQLLDRPLDQIKRLIKDHHQQDKQLPGLYLVGKNEHRHWVTINVVLTQEQHYSIFFTRAEVQQQLEHDIVRENILAARSQCYAGLLHEIGNPMAAIDGMLTELHQQISGLSEQQHNCFELLRSQLERINRIRYKTAILSSPQVNNEQQLYSLNEHLTGLSELLAFDKRAIGTKLLLALDPALPAMTLDQDKLTQIVINLISNSLDACLDNDHGEIEIATWHRSDQLELTVTDNGCGMTSEIRGQALQAHFSTKTRGAGLGLGLSICNTLTTELGGKIAILSSHNSGTQVRLSFRLQELP